MKKIMVILCATALLGLGACNKDKDKKGNGGNQSQAEQSEGLYNPSAKIDRVHYSNSTSDEVWQWQGDRVVSITTETADGGEETSIILDYNDEGRIQSVFTGMMGAQVEVDFNYNAQKLITGATVGTMGYEMANATVSHNTQKKVDHISLDIDDAMLNELIQLLSMFIGDSNNILPFATVAPDSKFSIDDKAFDAYFAWSGNNVSRMIINARINLTTTLNELPTELLATLVPEEYASMIDLALELAGDQPLPIQLTVIDTVDYTYDSHKNPLQGFLGRMSIAALSANNIVSVASHGNANIEASLSMGMLGSLPLSYDYPLDEMGSASYSYTYTSAGYPHVVTDHEGNTTEYTYKQ